MTYAIFMRRPVVFAPRLALQWLEDTGRERNTEVEVDQRYIEGKWVGAGEPMMYITGSPSLRGRSACRRREAGREGR